MGAAMIDTLNIATMPIADKVQRHRGSKPEPPKIPSADQRGLSRARSMG